VTPVRSRRGRLVHAVEIGIRRDLPPESIPTLVCGKRLKGCVIVDEYIDCPHCCEILFNQN